MHDATIEVGSKVGGLNIDLPLVDSGVVSVGGRGMTFPYHLNYCSQ